MNACPICIGLEIVELQPSRHNVATGLISLFVMGQLYQANGIRIADRFCEAHLTMTSGLADRTMRLLGLGLERTSS